MPSSDRLSATGQGKWYFLAMSADFSPITNCGWLLLTYVVFVQLHTVSPVLQCDAACKKGALLADCLRPMPCPSLSTQHATTLWALLLRGMCKTHETRAAMLAAQRCLHEAASMT